MRKTLHVLAALILMIPIYLGLASSPLDGWFQSGAGWRAFEPLFDALHALGIHGEGDILIGTMLVISFGIALVLVWIVTRLFQKSKLRTQQ
ncbi:hypothetical protein E5U26_10565 [Burkholderia pseudomallei]|uniref:hypothetical protein n=1 Tax=Burkholderia pseudomallei TaxID=28450 RepID=UPI001560728B|nr:hypothetical protein [Burkholderia pseudomallei]NRE31113.1 hypothetical protein [Burkholderia pseudomallei]